VELTLQRLEVAERPTLGFLEISSAPSFSHHLLTLELPFRDNQKNISCIPKGTYECVRVYNRAIGFPPRRIPITYEVKDVPGRSGILFHAGNFVSNTQGCILLGLSLSKEPYIILESRQAMVRFISLLKGHDGGSLKIV